MVPTLRSVGHMCIPDIGGSGYHFMHVTTEDNLHRRPTRTDVRLLSGDPHV